MNRAGPPGNGKGGLPAVYPKTAKANDVGRSVTDFASFGNHRIVRVRYALEPWQWVELRWSALTTQFYAEWRAML
jgi:hypothetical protein